MGALKHYWTILRGQPRPGKFLLSRLLMRSGLSRRIVMARDGYRIRFHPAALSSVIWLNPQERRAEERMLKRCVTPGDRVFDVGANIGTVTLALADAVGPQGRVIALEPHPQIFAFLEDNLALNRVGHHVTALNMALGAEDGHVGFSNLSDDSQNHIVAGAAGAVEIPLRPLDKVAPDGPIRLIKIDVEGYEPEVLRGASEVLGRSEILYVECIAQLLKRFGSDEAQLVDLIERHGFRIYQWEGDALCPNRVGDKPKKMLFCLRHPEELADRLGLELC